MSKRNQLKMVRRILRVANRTPIDTIGWYSDKTYEFVRENLIKDLKVLFGSELVAITEISNDSDFCRY